MTRLLRGGPLGAFVPKHLTSFLSTFLTFDQLLFFSNLPTMSLSKLGVFANLALAASAVLLPPTITADSLGDDNALKGLVVNPSKRSAYLECPDCALAIQEEDSLSWKKDAGNTFVSSLPQHHGGLHWTSSSVASSTKSSNSVLMLCSSSTLKSAVMKTLSEPITAISCSHQTSTKANHPSTSLRSAPTPSSLCACLSPAILSVIMALRPCQRMEWSFSP
jgi:hypothetical protein